jgi:hypothetical protein
MRAKGLGHVPPRLRAWIALRDPDLASAHGLDQGVSLVSMRAAEQRGEPPVHAAQSRLAELDRRIAEDVTKRRRAVFEAREQRLQTTAAADSAWQEMISAIQANAPEGGV